MIGSLRHRLALGSTALVLGGLGAVVAQSPAYAADFSAAYTCTAPVLGTQHVTIDGSLTASPNPGVANTPIDVKVHLAQISLRAPVTINSWTITVNLDVSGAETAQFEATGSGGKVPANQPIKGDLAGKWTPTTVGTDEIRGGKVTVRANVFLLGNVTVNCTADGPRPVGETVTVN